jgi:N-acetylneuraminate synthase/N,N'-diacetyllegionaminate synthase
MALAAVAAGATLVEKHLTTDRELPGPDHRASLEPAEFRAMVDGIRATSAALGTGIKTPVAAERPIAAVARKSLHWRVSLEAGATVEADHLLAMRPGTGLAPSLLGDIVGRKLARPVTAGTAAAPDDLELRA